MQVKIINYICDENSFKILFKICLRARFSIAAAASFGYYPETLININTINMTRKPINKLINNFASKLYRNFNRKS